MRMPGDVVFILGGTLPILYLAWLGVRHMQKGSSVDSSQDHLFIEVAVQTKER